MVIANKQYIHIPLACQSRVYCPYCLGFAAVMLLLFLLNFDITQKWSIFGSVAVGFVLSLIFFKGSVVPTYTMRERIPVEVVNLDKTVVKS